MRNSLEVKKRIEVLGDIRENHKIIMKRTIYGENMFGEACPASHWQNFTNKINK